MTVVSASPARKPHVVSQSGDAKQTGLKMRLTIAGSSSPERVSIIKPVDTSMGMTPLEGRESPRLSSRFQGGG